MEVRDGIADAIESARRCYQAIASATDVEEGRALWRAFGKYMRKGTPEAVDSLGSRAATYEGSSGRAHHAQPGGRIERSGLEW